MLRETKETIESIASPEERTGAGRALRGDERSGESIQQPANDGKVSQAPIAPKRLLVPSVIIIATMIAAAVLIGVFASVWLGALIGVACLVYIAINPAVRASMQRGSSRDNATHPRKV